MDRLRSRDEIRRRGFIETAGLRVEEAEEILGVGVAGIERGNFLEIGERGVGVVVARSSSARLNQTRGLCGSRWTDVSRMRRASS